MTHHALTRAHLEATLVAYAVVQPDRRADLLERVDRLRVSASAVGLLEQLAAPIDGPDDNWIWAATKGQHALMARVEAITIADLCFWPEATLLSLVNQLPERTERPAAWERDLERGTCAA